MKMATGQKRARVVDYKQLNSFSSAVLFDTAPRSKKSKFFEVERVITRRRIRYVSCVGNLFDTFKIRLSYLEIY